MRPGSPHPLVGRLERWRDRHPVAPAAWLPASLLVVVLCVALFTESPYPPRDAPPRPSHNCRFWACTSTSISGPMIADHLINLPHSLESLSNSNPNGWSVTYYAGGSPSPIVARGAPAAHLDSLFDRAVGDAAGGSPTHAIAHIRACSSGPCDIPNPHPFERVKIGKHWLMGHNGAIEIRVLLELIRPEYLALNAPQYGSGPGSWIDSDLYFIYVLQTIEDHDWEVKPALGEVIQRLREQIPGEVERLNFVLSDGLTTWAYRQGATLFYRHDTSGTPCSSIASMYPTQSQEDWILTEDGQLLTLLPDAPLVVEEIESYFEPTSVVEPEWPAPFPRRLVLEARPNPFSRGTAIHFTLSSSAPVEMQIHDVGGRRVRRLARGGEYVAGEHVIQWDGNGDSGESLPSGIYFCRLQTIDASVTRRLLLVR